MKRPALYTLWGLLFLACAGDAEEYAPEASVVTIPIEVCDDATSLFYTRANPGDPGVTNRLPKPAYLYIWAEIETTEDPSPQIAYWHITITPPSSFWTEQSDRLQGKHTVEVPGGKTLKTNSRMQVYIIASKQNLDDELLEFNKNIFGEENFTAPAQANAIMARGTTDPKLADLCKGLAIDLSAWCTTTSVDHSAALRDLYSTPTALAGDGTDDGKSLGNPTLLHNGTYTVVKKESDLALDGTPTRLYHCAAKADFKWEVPEANQATTKLATITLTGLPTTLKVFDPTHNPAPTSPGASCLLLGDPNADGAPAAGYVNPLNVGNWWIGREVAYVLQPPVPVPGNVSYTVTFAAPPEKTAVNATTPSATNPVFTTWYRTIADVK